MFAIHNATVYSAANSVMRNTTIVIENNKIKEIGKDLDLNICSEIIDGTGKFVTPGFIDTHTHLGIDEEGMGWEGADFNETSHHSTPHLRALDGINPFDQGFSDAAQSGITTVQVLPGSANVIGGITSVVKVKPLSVVEDILLVEKAGLKAALGENPKKFHGTKGRNPVTRMGVAALIRDALVEASNYLNHHQERNLRLETLGDVLQKKMPLCVHAHRADDIMTAIRIAEEFDIDLHLEHLTEAHLIAEHLKKYKDRIKFSIGPTFSSRSKVELKNISWDTYHVLDQQGIPFSIITDHPVVPISHLKTSVQLAVEHGLDIDTALRSVTIHAAEVLGIDDVTGSIEVGKDADIVIWDGHPITENGTPYMTFVEGMITYGENVRRTGR